jgi:16S rRNA (guanine966-N2)-methyltransferase
VREALFNIIGNEVVDARVLDLFAGSGALGIEALSRGASEATFIDAERACCEAIAASLGRLRLEGRGRVVRGRLPGAIANIEGEFGLVFSDPPYGIPEGDETLVAVGGVTAAGGLVVYEHSSRYNPPVRTPGMARIDRRDYGDTSLSFYRRQEAG